MKKRIAISAALVVLGGCNDQREVTNVDGLKMGMQIDEVAALGYECSTENEVCVLPNEGTLSLLGMQAKPRVHFENGSVNFMQFFVENYSYEELIDAYIEEFGEPERCRHNNTFGNIVERNVWVDSSGSTITIRNILDAAPQSGAASNPRRISHVTYRDELASVTEAGKTC